MQTLDDFADFGDPELPSNQGLFVRCKIASLCCDRRFPRRLGDPQFVQRFFAYPQLVWSALQASVAGRWIDLMLIKMFIFNLRSVRASTFEERRRLFPSQLVPPSSGSIQPSPSASPRSPSSDRGTSLGADRVADPPKALFYPSASTSLSPGSTETTVTCHLITPQLALLALIPTQTFEGRRGLVEYNVVYFREGVQEIWQVEHEARARE